MGAQDAACPRRPSPAVDGADKPLAGERACVVVEWARALRGWERSLRPIAAALDAEGHRPRGMRWCVQTLSRLLRT